MESLRPRALIEYFEVLWRKKSLIFLVAASVSVATFLIIRRIPNYYESRATIVIANQGNSDRLLSIPSLNALTEQITSHANLTEIVRRYDLYRRTPGRIPDRPDPNVAVERLRRGVKIDIKMRNYYPDAPESLTISYRYTDPGVAQRVVADLVSIFEQTNVTVRRQAATELERFHGKVTDVESQLQALGPQRDLALLRSEAARPDGAPSAVNAQRLAAANSIDSLRDKEFTLERQIDEQKRQIAEQEKLVRSAPPARGVASNSAYGILLTRRAEVEGQIKDLATYATERNPKMVQARTQLVAINQEIARLEAAGGTSLGEAINSASPEARELRAMQRESQRLETDLEVTRRDLNRKTQTMNSLPTAAVAETVPSEKLNEARAEYDRLMGRYTWLMDKQDSLQKISGDDGQRVTMFQIVDAPIAQRAPVGPNRLLLMLLGLGMALALGLFAAAALEAPRFFLINSDRDAEYYLGAPVLALIPETLTPFERSRRRRLWGLRWIGLALLLGAMIPLFIAALDRAQIFQILANR